MSASKWRLTVSLLCVLGTCEIFANRTTVVTSQAQLDGLKNSIEILRDRWGVPHI